jgi:uncharacterized iron-regulated membrane protein
MRIPVWLTLGVAILVIAFGVHRLRLSFRSEDEEARARERKGLYSMNRRTHRLIGIVYLLLGGALVATTFGWNPFGDAFGPGTEVPKATDKPTSTNIPIDQLPPPKKN